MKKTISIILLLVLIMSAIIVLPSNVFAAEDVFDEVLTDGKLVIPSVLPENETLINDTISVYMYEEKESNISVKSWLNDTYTRCILSYYPWPDPEQTKEVEVVWDYDEDVKAIVDELVKNYPTDKKTYILNDFEILNKYINGGSLPNNSLEFKKYNQYKNFYYYIDQRGGGAPELKSALIGMLKCRYNDTLYWIGPNMEFIGEDIVYVDTNTTDVKKALEDRLVELFPGHTFEVTKEDDRLVSDIINAYIQEATDWYNRETDYFVSEGYATLEDYLATKTEYEFLNGAEANLYDIAVDDAFGFEMAVKKDSSKMITPDKLVTNDIVTDVTIIADNTIGVPLDTLIQAKELTSGIEYDKIVSVLEATDVEMYDLKLYSKATDAYISQLEDGKFEVKIPVSDTLKGKALTAYYVDEKDKVIEYEVTIDEDGYATFVTDHFSIYTLVGEEKEEVASEETAEEEAVTEEKDATPKTGVTDISGYVAIITAISVLGIVVIKRTM